MANYVFIATSLDGYIADKNSQLGWLDEIPKVEPGVDMGFDAHMNRVDALVMGRNTLEFVLNAGVDWPYNKPVYVLSNSWNEVPKGYEDKIFLTRGEPKAIVAELAAKGLNNLYIDGGEVITQFLNQNLIDEMIIATVPVVLGGGYRLFGELEHPVLFKHVRCERFNETIFQNYYIRAD